MDEKRKEVNEQTRKKKRLGLYTVCGITLFSGCLAIAAIHYTTPTEKENQTHQTTKKTEEATGTDAILPKKTTQKEKKDAQKTDSDEILTPVDDTANFFVTNKKDKATAQDYIAQEKKKQKDDSPFKQPDVIPVVNPTNDDKEKDKDDPIIPPTPETSTPVLSVSDVTIAKGTSFKAADYVSVSDRLDQSPRVYINTADVNTNEVGSYTVRVSAINKFGKTDEKTFTVTVGSVPVINLAQDSVDVKIGTNFNPLDYVSAMDEVDGNLKQSLQFSDGTDLNKEGTYTVSYSITNSYGFTAQASIQVRVVNQAPTLVANELHQEVNQPFNVLDGVTATAYNGESIALSEKNIFFSNVDPTKEGTYIQIFRVADRFGKWSNFVKRTVYVENEAPKIHGVEDKTVHVHGSLTKDELLKNVTATDREDDKQGLSLAVNLDKTQYAAIDTNKVGDYPITYRTTDSMGKETIATATVHVVNDAPVLYGVDDKEINVGDAFDSMEGVYATDTESEKTDVTVEGTVDTTTAGTYTLHYTATDQDGATTKKDRVITVKETEQTKGQQVVDTAKKYLGIKYVWGGNTPDGFDCSGLVQYVYQEALGMSLPRVTTDQEQQGTDVALDQLQVGDLLFWGAKGATTHVAIYIGDEQYIHAPTEGEVVKITSMKNWKPDFAKRVLT